MSGFLIMLIMFLLLAYVVASSILLEKITDLMMFNGHTFKSAVTDGLTTLGKILFVIELPLMIFWWIVIMLMNLIFDIKFIK